MKLSSENKTILLVSDIHQDWKRINDILKKETCDEVVVLGDELDSFYYNSEDDLAKTLDFIKENIFKSNFHFLWGNHTLPYFWGYSRHTACSGYYKWKHDFLTKYLGSLLPKIREKYLWYCWIDDRLVSHAGLSPYFLPPHQQLDKKSLSKWLNSQIKQAEMALVSNGGHFLFRAGYGRGGSQTVGGLTWLDFSEEFEPIEGLSQVVGHTSDNNIRPHHTEGALDPSDWQNICIDNHLNSWLLIKKKKIQIKHYKDL